MPLAHPSPSFALMGVGTFGMVASTVLGRKLLTSRAIERGEDRPVIRQEKPSRMERISNYAISLGCSFSLFATDQLIASIAATFVAAQMTIFLYQQYASIGLRRVAAKDRALIYVLLLLQFPSWALMCGPFITWWYSVQ